VENQPLLMEPLLIKLLTRAPLITTTKTPVITTIRQPPLECAILTENANKEKVNI